MVILRQEHQQTPGNADLRGQPRAFGSDRILDNLNRQRLPLKNLFFDGHLGAARCAGRLAIRWAVPDISHMQKCRALQADVNEGRLHPRQDPGHLAKIHIADQAALKRAFNMQFLHGPVFHHRHAGFMRRPVNQNIFLHGA